MKQTNKTEKKTVKTGKLILLPTVKNYIYQPNRITNAIYNYTLLQERIFTAIIYYLQDPIKSSMANRDFRQLDLFTEGTDKIRVNIPLREISQPKQYHQVKQAIKEMAGIVLEIPFKTKDNKNYLRITSLFSAYIPEKADYTSIISIDIEKGVAEKIIEIDKNEISNHPINYTRYVYEIAQNAQTKYTSKMYKLISSWKKKGGFMIKIEDIKENLGVKGMYPNYADFKRRILLPVQLELYEKADCWFNCRAKDFEIREGKTVTHLNFKVITPEFALEDTKKADYIRNILRIHYNFTENDLKAINYILQNEDISNKDVINKISKVDEYLSTNSQIIHRKEYLMKALLQEFLSENS